MIFTLDSFLNGFLYKLDLTEFLLQKPFILTGKRCLKRQKIDKRKDKEKKRQKSQKTKVERKEKRKEKKNKQKWK